MIILDVDQNSDEWMQARLGIPTASCFEKIVTTTGSPSKQREKYLYKLAGERLSGVASDGYYGPQMQRGHQMESEAMAAYEFINDVKIDLVGLCYKDERRLFSCSPDGLIGGSGGYEGKSAAPHVQVERIEKGWSKADHFQQVQGCLWITGREWWDLQSYCPGIKPIIIRFERDEKFISTLEEEVERFCEELQSLVMRIAA